MYVTASYTNIIFVHVPCDRHVHWFDNLDAEDTSAVTQMCKYHCDMLI